MDKQMRLIVIHKAHLIKLYRREDVTLDEAAMHWCKSSLAVFYREKNPFRKESKNVY